MEIEHQFSIRDSISNSHHLLIQSFNIFDKCIILSHSEYTKGIKYSQNCYQFQVEFQLIAILLFPSSVSSRCIQQNTFCHREFPTIIDQLSFCPLHRANQIFCTGNVIAYHHTFFEYTIWLHHSSATHLFYIILYRYIQ